MRLEAYEEITKSFATSPDENAPCFQPFLNSPDLFRKIVTDSNVVAQEHGITALNTFLEFGGINACLRLRNTVLTPMIEKAIGQTRAGTKQKTLDALCWFIELDSPDPVVEDLIPFLTHKTPKLVVATTHALVEIFKLFGAKTVSPKPIIPIIPKLFGHADKNVRAQASELTVELYKWMGSAIETIIFPDLKPVQQKDLQSAFEKVKDETPHQQRFLRSQQAAQESNGYGDDPMDIDEEEPEIDAFDMLEAVDILSKIPDDFYKNMGSSKWKERKEALEGVEKIVNTPKIADGDYTELVRTLAKCMKDANVQVLTIAANCITFLGTGLRTSFSKYQAILLDPILERTKEKKASVAEALRSALDSLFQCTSLSEILEPTVAHLNHKTPNIKLESAHFLTRCLKETKEAPSPAEVEQIMVPAIKLIADTQEVVRTATAETIGTLMKITGERAMTPYMEKIDEKRQVKIKEFFESAVVKAKPRKPPQPKAKAPPSRGQASNKRQSTQAPKAAPKSAPGAGTRKLVKPGVRPGSRIAARPQSRSSTASDEQPTSNGTAARPKSKIGITSALKKRVSLAPPKRPSPPSPAPDVVEPQYEEPEQPVSPRPTFAKGTVIRGPAVQTPITPPSSADSMLSIQEKAEFEALKAQMAEFEALKIEKMGWDKEKEKLEWLKQDLKEEKTKLYQEITTLQVQNSKLIEDHTRTAVLVKSKETQLMKSESDVQFAKGKILKLEQEVESLKQQLEQQKQELEKLRTSSRPSNRNLSPPQAPSNGSSNDISSRRSPLRPASSRREPAAAPVSRRAGNTSRNRPYSIIGVSGGSRSQFDLESRLGNLSMETEEDYPMTDTYQPPTRTMSMMRSSGYSNGRQGVLNSNNNNINGQPISSAPMRMSSLRDPAAGADNWRRASEVTSQLKARIENMKARSMKAQQTKNNLYGP